jgi:hypothetical protein
MAMLPSADPNQVLFETQIVEENGVVMRDGNRLGNRVTFGEPYACDLAAYFAAEKRQLAYPITDQLGSYDFWLLRLVCTLHPSGRLRVRWFELQVNLVYPPALPQNARMLNRKGATLLSSSRSEQPTVFALYPSKVVDEVDIEHTVEISPELQIAPYKLAGKDAITAKYKQVHPKLRAFHDGPSRCYWRFEPGKSRGVEEGDRELDLVVRKRRGTLARAEIAISGEGWEFGIFPQPLSADPQHLYF